MSRSYDEELKYLEKLNDVTWSIKKGFVNNMKVEGRFYVNEHLEKLMFDELREACKGLYTSSRCFPHSFRSELDVSSSL